MKINELNTVSSPSTSDLVRIYSSANGSDLYNTSIGNLATIVKSQITTPATWVTKYAAPSATGFSVPLSSDGTNQWLVLTPVAGYAAGTITLPAKTSAVAGQEILVNSSQAVTTLTVAGNGATVTGAPTTIAQNGFFRLKYEVVLGVWYRVG